MLRKESKAKPTSTGNEPFQGFLAGSYTQGPLKNERTRNSLSFQFTMRLKMQMSHRGTILSESELLKKNKL